MGDMRNGYRILVEKVLLTSTWNVRKNMGGCIKIYLKKVVRMELDEAGSGS